MNVFNDLMVLNIKIYNLGTSFEMDPGTTAKRLRFLSTFRQFLQGKTFSMLSVLV